VRNKFDIRFEDATITKAAREYRIKANKGAKVVAKGIQTGQYTAPISKVIWPENNVPGSTCSPNAFNQFSNLKDGFVFDNKQWGQLKPFPGAPVPVTAKSCTGTELGGGSSTPPPTTGEAPVASAGTALTGQLAGSLITLTGLNKNTKLTDAQLTDAWTRPPEITITNADKPVRNFVNPWQATTTPATTRAFTLKICLASSATTCSSATVDVTTDKIQDTVSITSYQFSTKRGGTITVVAKSDNVLTGADGANLQIQIQTAVFQPMTASGGGTTGGV
jgi:hypothetical protein